MAVKSRKAKAILNSPMYVGRGLTNPVTSLPVDSGSEKASNDLYRANYTGRLDHYNGDYASSTSSAEARANKAKSEENYTHKQKYNQMRAAFGVW